MDANSGRNNWIGMVPPPSTLLWTDGVLVPVMMPEREDLNMEARLHVGNLSKSTTQDELNALFTQAGVVTATEVIKDRKSGESKGFGFVTMSAQEEADKAISMFNAYELSGKELKVSMAKAKEQNIVARPTLEP